jgi:hypothetical protein
MTKLSSLIQEIRKKRRAENPSQLTDGELVMELAGLLSDAPDDRQLIACVLAVNLRSGPDSERALQLLRDIGISECTTELLATVRRHRAFRELQKLLLTCRADSDDPMSSENFERIRDLTIAAGSVLGRASLRRGT